MRSSKRKWRAQLGATMMLLVAVIAFLILPIGGLLAFEIGRANLCQQQLQNAVDAASLAGVATLAMNDNPNSQVAHDNAVAAAMDVFRQNSILGMDLSGSNTTEQAVPNTNPGPGQADLYFEFLDPITGAVLPRSDPRAQKLQVFGVIGTQPAFGRYLGVNNFDVRTNSHGAVPDLDVVLCYDCSGSIDDQTNVTLVRRVWNDNPLYKTQYLTPVAPGRPANGTIFNIAQPSPTGTSLNGAPPQWLSQLPGFDCDYPLRSGFQSGNYSGSEVGMPPGNSVPPPAVQPVPPVPPLPPGFGGFGAPAAGAQMFTDMVVNIDGNTTFGGCVYNGFNFPNIAALVEAARGNLDTPAAYSSSRAYSSCPSIVPRVGYQAAYLEAANKNSQPIQAARDASTLFAQIINNDTTAHFGFVAFNQTVGANDSSRIFGYNEVDSSPAYGPDPGRALPMSRLDSTPANSRFLEINQAIGGGGTVPIPGPVATGSTNIGAAVSTAVDQLITNQRPNAVRAIVLFTDGQPTAGGPLAADPWANARDAAVRARNAGIPVYCIGLAQTPAIIPGQNSILNDTDNNPASGGIAAISGQGAKFYQVVNQAQLRLAFEKIARRLVQLVQR